MKRALVDGGFIVFRTLPEEVVVAERVRENLIMDSGVRLRCAPGTPSAQGEGSEDPRLEVRVVLRVQRGDFPGEDDAKLFDRVRGLGVRALAAGFREVANQTSHVTDPGDSSRMLDTFYEVVLARDAATLDAALDGVRFAFGLERVGHAGV